VKIVEREQRRGETACKGNPCDRSLNKDLDRKFASMASDVVHTENDTHGFVTEAQYPDVVLSPRAVTLRPSKKGGRETMLNKQ
jgi:hypothetical protein